MEVEFQRDYKRHKTIHMPAKTRRPRKARTETTFCSENIQCVDAMHLLQRYRVVPKGSNVVPLFNFMWPFATAFSYAVQSEAS